MEATFVFLLAAFALVELCMGVGPRIATACSRKCSMVSKAWMSFERRHPNLCDRDGVFYCFFKRDCFDHDA